MYACIVIDHHPPSWLILQLSARIGCLRVRCVFSESSNGQTLKVKGWVPPGGVALMHANRASVNMLTPVLHWVLYGPNKVIRPIVNDFITTLFPASCRSCDGPLERAGLVPVCAACIGRVIKTDYFACERCGEAINLDLDLEDMRFAGLLSEGFQCRECKLASPPFERAVAFATYAGEMRTLIHLLKFKRVKGVARLLGYRLAETILQLETQTAPELLVIAVPLFRTRERERGYNQSVLLANQALRWLRRMRPTWKLIPSHSALVRIRRTKGQWVLSPKGRRRNLKGAFRVQGDVRGREILLIDDVLTSGATARECAQVLRHAGATKVWVVTLARTQKQFVRRQHEDPEEYIAQWDMPIESKGQELETTNENRRISVNTDR